MGRKLRNKEPETQPHVASHGTAARLYIAYLNVYLDYSIHTMSRKRLDKRAVISTRGYLVKETFGLNREWIDLGDPAFVPTISVDLCTQMI